MARPSFPPLLAGLTYGTPALAQLPAVSTAAAEIEQPLVEVVVASSPTRGAELPERQVAGSVQRVSGAQIRSAHGSTLADALQKNVAGISLNDTQGSPFLPARLQRGSGLPPSAAHRSQEDLSARDSNATTV